MANLWVESFKCSFTLPMLGPSNNSHSTIQVKDDCSDTNMIWDLFIIMTHKRIALNEQKSKCTIKKKAQQEGDISINLKYKS